MVAAGIGIERTRARAMGVSGRVTITATSGSVSGRNCGTIGSGVGAARTVCGASTVPPK